MCVEQGRNHLIDERLIEPSIPPMGAVSLPANAVKDLGGGPERDAPARDRYTLRSRAVYLTSVGAAGWAGLPAPRGSPMRSSPARRRLRADVSPASGNGSVMSRLIWRSRTRALTTVATLVRVARGNRYRATSNARARSVRST